jgi:hypothetical protein
MNTDVSAPVPEHSQPCPVAVGHGGVIHLQDC